MAETKPLVVRKADMLPAPVIALVQSLVPDCSALLPADITTEQFRAALWLELTGRPDLHDCTGQSLRECVVKAATYGLLPGRDCHFLPFRNRKGGSKVATYVPNYQGIILALERTGKVRRAFANPVHEGDYWEYDTFSDRPVHKQAVTLGKKQGPELFYYGAIQFKDGTFAVDVVTLEDLDKIRRSSPAHESGPWVDWPAMMKRKSALKRVAKYVRLTPEIVSLLDDDDLREREDIPEERHQKNIMDLFGDVHGSPLTPRDAPGVVQGQATVPPSTPDPSTAPEAQSAPPTPRQERWQPTPADPAWKLTLRAHQGLIEQMAVSGIYGENQRAELEALVEALRYALSPLGITSDANGYGLADAVLQWVDMPGKDGLLCP